MSQGDTPDSSSQNTLYSVPEISSLVESLRRGLIFQQKH